MRFRSLAAVIVAFGAAACGSSSEEEVWRFAIEEIDGSVQHAYATRFESLIEERTKGAVSVEVYPYGSLGTSTQLIGRSGTFSFRKTTLRWRLRPLPTVAVHSYPTKLVNRQREERS